MDAKFKARDEAENAAENIDSVPEPDSGYIENGTEIVGYVNRSIQHQDYRNITQLIPTGQSILDFGCGRGDYQAWHELNFGKNSVNYIGVDFNEVLIEAGKKLYNGINLINQDWMDIDDNIKQDWCINVNSNILRYDVSNDDDLSYLHKTIEKMYNHANKGIVIKLASSLVTEENQLIKYNPGELFNWAQEKFGLVALDHSNTNEEFLLIIYKN
jgi:SAM-dependent methyltransferase